MDDRPRTRLSPRLGGLLRGDSAYEPLQETSRKQTVYIDEDIKFDVIPYRHSARGQKIYVFLCIVSLGAIYLLSRWFPKLWLYLVCKPDSFIEADRVCVTNQWGEFEVIEIENAKFEGALKDIFDEPSLSPSSGIDSETTTAGRDTVISFGHSEEIIHELRYFEYKYHKLLFNPITERFQTIAHWRDKSWITVDKVIHGVDKTSKVNQRRILFGANEIQVKEKSTFRLLVDEVLNPFYIFQVFSMILWSIDNYYYYATCILLMSSFSVGTTLIETKRTFTKLRNMSRFSCRQRVWRNNEWWTLNSEEMVPGDIFEVNVAFSSIIPCDAVMLDGDCIVNESMLTGESIPIAKNPISDEDLAALNFEEENPAESAKLSRFFLFSGTKLIRSRPGKRFSSSASSCSKLNSSPSSSFSASSTSSNNTTLNASGIKSSGKKAPPPSPIPFVPIYTNMDRTIERGSIAMVVRTGFNTEKGNLIRSMLFPKPNQFQFYRDSFRFIGVLSLIAVFGFLITSYNFFRMGVSWTTIMIRALDLITIVVPPALPATMSIGTSFAISRLKKLKIFCISPPRVNICGKLNIMCFDKTGTLTEEGLDVLGFRVITAAHANIKRKSFSAIYHSIEEIHKEDRLRSAQVNDFDNVIVSTMAACHSLKQVQDQLIGDPLDLKMFQFTGWHFEEIDHPMTPREPVFFGRRNSKPSINLSSNIPPPASPTHVTSTGAGMPIVGLIVRPPFLNDQKNGHGYAFASQTHQYESFFNFEIGVVRTLEFQSSLRRMSVVASKLHIGGVEGPPKKNVVDPSKLSSTPPFETLLGPLSPREFHVYVKGAPEVMKDICRSDSFPSDYSILLKEYTNRGYRVLACAYKKFENVTMEQVNKMSRQEIESGLHFVGFVVFENKIKKGTVDVIDQLNAAQIRQVMCTGDNVLTAISVGKECGIIPPDHRIFTPKLVSEEPVPESIEWEDTEHHEIKLEPRTLKPSSQDFQFMPDYSLAVTGDVFQFLVDEAPLDLLNKVLVKTQIFARMSPEQKHNLVERLQDIGYCVGFCGDGANDCGALKSSDVGLSLSEAEASVAAPFTSQEQQLYCVLQLIREGRAALVTSFSSFKYMALYSLIQFTSVSLMYALGSNLGDFQYLYIDIFLIVPIATVMGYSKSYHKLHPKRPTATLLSKRVLSSLLGQILLQGIFQSIAFYWVRTVPNYEPPAVGEDTQSYKCFENTAVFLLSCFEYISVAVIFSVGPPYREKIWQNTWFAACLPLLLFLTTGVVISPPKYLFDKLELVELQSRGHITILVFAILHFICAYYFEQYIAPWIANVLGHWSLKREIIDDGSGMMNNGQYFDQVSSSSSSTNGHLDPMLRRKISRWKRKGKKYKVIQAEW